MSSVVEHYKLFEPSFHPQRPIIVEDGIESPETITLRYEEQQAARENGEGDSPTSLVPMATSTYKSLPQLHVYPDSQYTHSSQYHPSQSYSQQTENGAAQLNNLAFAASNNAAQYMTSSQPSAFTVISSIPTTGGEGTSVQIRIASHLDFLAMGGASPFVYVVFGSAKCQAAWAKEGSQDVTCVYTVTAEAPSWIATGHHSSTNVPMAIVVEGGLNGQELARVDSAGFFTYHGIKGVSNGGVLTGADQGACEDVMNKSGRSPARPQLTLRTSSTSPAQSQLSANSATNNYDYTPAVDSAGAAAQHSFASAANTFGQDNSMLGYRSASFSVADGYPRSAQPSMLRTTPFGYGSLSATTDRYTTDRYTTGRGSLGHGLTSITRPSLTPSLPVPNSQAPQLVRTSTLQSSSAPNPWNLYPHRAMLNIAGNLDSMASDWTHEEWDNKRRIVVFRKKQNGGQVEVTFRPVPVDQRPPHSICISCIWWAEKGECYVTSVDTIHLLEQLAAAPNRFTVEEKNRIRRNLEGFKPATVSKAKADSEEFFKIIMGFPNPKPRNIEKDVKVFPWKVLSHALKKIFSKYSASPSAHAGMPAANAPAHMLTPSYPVLPPTPGPTSALPDTSGYLSAHAQGNGGMISPRSLSATSSNWPAQYSTSDGLSQQQQPQQQQQQQQQQHHHQRAISPHSKMPSPTTTPSLRMSSMSAMPGYDARAQHQHSKSMAHIYNLQATSQAPPSHHQQQQQQQHLSATGIPVSQGQQPSPSSHMPRWENYSMAAPDAGGYSGAHSAGGHQVYPGAYEAAGRT